MIKALLSWLTGGALDRALGTVDRYIEMRYADDFIGGRRYVLTLPGAGENQLTLGLGVDVAFDGGMRMSLGYGNTFGDGTHRQSLVLRIGLHRALPMR